MSVYHSAALHCLDISLASFCGLRIVSLLMQVDTHAVRDCCDLLLDAVSS